MKKKLFWALLAALLLVLAASTALAAVTEVCPVCEIENLTWSENSDTQHHRFCGKCGRRDVEDHTYDSNGKCTKCDWNYCAHDALNSAQWEYNESNTSYHTKRCTCGWSVNERHTGGTATCTQKAVCDVCNHEYGNLSSTNHAGTIEWNPDNSDAYVHRGTCSACSQTVSENHYGGTANCNNKAFCSICRMPYGEKDPNNHNMANIYKHNEEQHKIKCSRCDYHEYENHSDSDGNGQCELCNTWYNCPHPENKMSEWTTANETNHIKKCTQCNNYTVVSAHTGGTATCTHGAVCDVCHSEYGSVNSNNHTLAAGGTYATSLQHNVTCSECNKEFRENHTGGIATCTQRAVCTVCGSAYGFPDFNNHTYTGNWEYASNGKHKRPCDCQYTEETESCVDTNGDDKCDKCGHMDCDHPADKLGYRYYSSQTHESYCTRCNWGFGYTTPHSGGTATCTQMAVCDFCNQEYGSANHVNMSAWGRKNDSQHQRTCLDCNNYIEAKNHTGGTATCTQKAMCDVCNTPYGDINAANHTQFTSWEHVQGTAKHMRECTNCGTLSIETGNCADSDSNGDGKCDTCGYWYNCSHPEDKLTAWRKVSETQHARSCQQCNNYTETKNHTFTVANCQSPATCTACGHTTGEKDSTNHANISPNWLHLFSDQHYKPCLNCWGNSGEKGTCSDANGDNHCDLCNNDMSGLCRHPEDKMSGWRMDPIKHYKECTQCYNYRVYDDHTGGVGTCSAWGECTLCGANYVSMDPNNHVNLSDWAYYSDTQHERHCLDCNNYTEYGNHAGGSATCDEKAVCSTCSTAYGALSTTHVNLSDWASCSDTQHERHCLDCNNYTEYGNHAGGSATCDEKAVCSTCSTAYGALSTTHVNLSDWAYYSETQHERHCTDCNDYTEYGNHAGGSATCSELAACDLCGEAYGEFSGNHVNYSNWKHYEGNQHVRHCLDCNDPDADLFGNCADGNGDGKCDDCGYAPNISCQHTSLTGWSYYSAQKHVRYCADCGAAGTYEYASHLGGAATCVAPAVCSDCHEAYGAADGAHLPGPTANCDDEQICLNEGCGLVLKEAIYHWYDLWTPNGDGTHTAECRREGCDHEKTSACTMQEVTVTIGESKLTFSFCLTCGGQGETIDEATGEPVGETVAALISDPIEDVLVQLVDGKELPRGELVVRFVEAPFEGVINAFLMTYELAGQVEPLYGTICVTLPFEMEEEILFKLVRVDGEIWTELEFTYENGELIFETDATGLFLLIPAEAEEAEAPQA